MLHLQFCCERWLSLRLDFIANLLDLRTSFCHLFAVKIFGKELINLCVINALRISLNLTWKVQNSTESEVLMSSTKRIIHYTDKIKSERKPQKIKNEFFLIREGNISFKDVAMGYSQDLDPVLFEVIYKICAGERAGIIVEQDLVNHL
jgi:hypothetical protein